MNELGMGVLLRTHMEMQHVWGQGNQRGLGHQCVDLGYDIDERVDLEGLAIR